MKLPRTVRFDQSDSQVYETAAEDGEWAVPGGFAFADDSAETLTGKRRQAFANGFLGLASFGHATFVTVASADEAVRERLRRIAGRRMTEDGILIIDARRFRTQERNRSDARERLIELIRRAAIVPRIRRPTRPTAGARRARLEDKKLRGRTKSLRRTTTDD